jgi:hypothetical protein
MPFLRDRRALMISMPGRERSTPAMRACSLMISSRPTRMAVPSFWLA